MSAESRTVVVAGRTFRFTPPGQIEELTALVKSDGAGHVVVADLDAAPGVPPVVVSPDCVLSAEAAPGDLVEVRTERGRPLGLAFFSSTSQITLRMLGDGSRDERELFSGRLRAALAYREALAPNGTAYRLVSAETGHIVRKNR